MYWFERGGFLVLTGMPRPVLGVLYNVYKRFCHFSSSPKKKKKKNPGQYKSFNLGQFKNRNKLYENRFLQNNNPQQNSNYTEIICNYCKKPGHLVRDCKIQPNNQSQTAHQENSKALPSTGALRKA